MAQKSPAWRAILVQKYPNTNSQAPAKYRQGQVLQYKAAAGLPEGRERRDFLC